MSATRAVFLVFCFFAVPPCLFPWPALDSGSGSGTHDGWTSSPPVQRRSSVAMLSGARAQACVPFRGSPGTAHKCDTFLQGTNVFLAPGQTYELVDEAAGNFTRLFGAFVPPNCRTAGLRLLCLSWFLPCDFSTTTGLTVLPPCRSVCEEMTLACYAFLESQGQLNQLPDCDLITNVTGTPVPAFLPFSCAYGPTDAVVPYSQADCPYPLNWDPQAAPGASDMCVAPCPNLFYSSGEWVAIRVVAYVFSFVSLVINLFLCVTWSLNPKKRRFPASVLLYISLCFIFFTGFQFLGVFFEPNSITCTKDWPPKPVSMDSAGENGGWGMGCIFQAMVFSYLTIAQILWWLALNINLFVLLVLEIRQERFMKLHKWYHLMCWGLPLISLILLLATKKVGGSISSPYCQFYSDEGRSWWDWAFVFGPTIPFLIVGMVLLCISVTKLVVLKFKRKESSLTSHLVRLMSMVIYFLINIGITYSFRIYAEVRYDDIQRAVEEQVQCSLETGTECEIEGGISYAYFFFVVFATATIGDAVFIFLGTTKETFGFWVRLIRARQADEGFLTHAWAMVKGHTSDSSSSGGGSSSPPASNLSNGSSLDFELASLSSKPSTNL